MRGLTTSIGLLLNRKNIKTGIIRINTISQIALVLMMFLTAADVILRYIFNSPILFAQEITEFSLVVCVSLGLSYCAIEKNHVSVDIIASKLPKRVLAVLDCFTGMLTIVFFLIIAWRSFIHMAYLAGNRVTSLTLFIPVYPFVGVVGVGFALFTIVLVMDLIDSIYGVFEK